MIDIEPHRYEPDGQHCTYRYSDGTWCFEPEHKHAPGGFIIQADREIEEELERQHCTWDMRD